MNGKLAINGLAPRSDFPTRSYEAVFEEVATRWSDQTFYAHFSGSWNALAYRFQGAADAGVEFSESLKLHGTSPAPQERYRQEQNLFAFFSGGFSTLESAFYAAYTIGNFLAPEAFPMTEPSDQRKISPSSTVKAFKRTFTDDPILSIFDELTADSAYVEWREIRNVLTHRISPGRRMFVGIGNDEVPSAQWKLNNIDLNEYFAQNHQAELARMIEFLVSGINNFLNNNNR